jgi:hypothetical protein
MAMRTKPYRAVVRMQPSVPGAAMDKNALTMAQKDGYRRIFFRVLGTALTLTSPATIEGTDYPFFTRFKTWSNRLKALRKRVKVWKAYRISRHRRVLGIPNTIFTAPPDTTPLFVAEFQARHKSAWLKRRLKAWKIRRSRHLRAPGYPALLTPASTYSDSTCRVLSEIQRHLLEGTIDDGLTWSLWTSAEVKQYFTERVSRFLVETGMLRTRATIAGIDSVDEYDLPSDFIELRRAQWLTTTRNVLTRVDALELDSGRVGWETEGARPEFIVLEPKSSLRVQLVPVPKTNGTIEIIYIRNEAAVSGCAAVPLPAMFTPYIKWGILADMLRKEGEANDPERSQHAEARFMEGVDLARLLLGSEE